MGFLRRGVGRWVVGVSVPLLVAWVVSIGGTVAARATYDSDELRSHDGAAWYHCTSGDNQNGSYVNHCFYTPNSVNYESNYWWCAAPGFGNFCPDPVVCTYGGAPSYGGQIWESWYDYYNNWISNSGDCVSQNYGYPWFDVYGP